MGYRKDDDPRTTTTGLVDEEAAVAVAVAGGGGGEDSIHATDAAATNNGVGAATATTRDIWATAQGYTPLTDLVAMAAHGATDTATTTNTMLSMGGDATPMFMGGQTSFQGVWVSTGPATADDDDDDDDSDSNHLSGGGGAFFADLSAFNAVAYQDDDDDSTSETNEGVVHEVAAAAAAGRPAVVTEEEEDFRAVANRALSVLERDYFQTVKGCTEVERQSRFQETRGLMAAGGAAEASSILKSIPPAADTAAAASNESSSAVSTGMADIDFASDWDSAFSNTNIITSSQYNNMPNSNSGMSDCKQPAASLPDTSSSLLPQPKNDDNNDISNIAIDAEAVRRAVHAIQLSKPRIEQQFSSWLLQHKEQQGLAMLPPATHALIPPGPLLAFRKRPKRQQQQQQASASSSTNSHHHRQHSTKASRAATARFSRAASLAECLHRLDILRGQEEGIVLHLLGCDGTMECGSDQQVLHHFGPLVEWIGNARQAPKSITIHCIGPNIPKEMETHGIDLIPPTSSSSSMSTPTTTTSFRSLESAKAYCHSVIYDEWLSDSGDNSKCDLILAFNAGVWGYKEWEPTIESLIQRRSSSSDHSSEGTATKQQQPLQSSSSTTPVIFTAYTLAEAEEDYEVIVKLWSSAGKAKETIEAACLWEPEVNPYASQQTRPTATAIPGQQYRENGAWQAWRF